MRQYSSLETEMQEAFERIMPITRAQSKRVTQLSRAVVEANSLNLSKLARVLPHETLQSTRQSWIQRLLRAPFLTQTHLYQPMLRSVLKAFKVDVWHLIIDRTGLPNQDKDIAMISLHYYGRSIPIYWQMITKGGAYATVYCAMIQEVARLVPDDQAVIFHGDNEFGSTEVIRLLKRLQWDFIMGIKGIYHLYDPKTESSRAFRDYDVPDTGTVEIPDVACFKSAQIPVNAIAFRQPHHSGGKRKRDYRYVVTSLPLTRCIRRIGRRRWGIEPLFEDYKSDGWGIDESYLSCSQRLQGMLVILAICYLWLVTTGRWLSKAGRRHEVDPHRRRHYSYFRIGWDWICHKFKLRRSIPYPLRLYP